MRLWAALYFPINWSSDPSTAFAIVTALYMGCLVWLAVQSRPSRRLWLPLGFILVAVIPPLHLLLIGADLVNSRILYLPSVGFCILIALAVEGLSERARYMVPA